MQGRRKLKMCNLFCIILCSAPLISAFSFHHKQNSSINPALEQQKSNLEMLLHNAKFKFDLDALKERGVVPITHEEEDPLPVPTSSTTTESVPTTTTVTTSSSTVGTTGQIANVSGPLSTMLSTLKWGNVSGTTSSLMDGDISSVKEDQPRPMTNFQNIKDAYFDLLKEFKEFRKSVSNKISTLEQKLELQKKQSDNSSQMADIYDKIIDIDLRHNLTRLMDMCVDKIMAVDIMDAVSIWQRIEMNVPNPVELETSSILKEIVSSAYIKNKSNSNPVFEFLRKLQNDVDKYPSYEYLLTGMMAQQNPSPFDGSSIFHIAQYLKEHNAVRSSLYSRIPKSVQYAVSGRNVNIIYVDDKASRNYLHVKDEGGSRMRGDRQNVYIRASQSYTDGKAAVWKTIYYPTTETFRIRNVLFNDYMFVNDEGFVEITSMANANQLGTEFDFNYENNHVIMKSKNYDSQPVVSTWTGGRFPFIFALKNATNENERKSPAQFIIEADTLL